MSDNKPRRRFEKETREKEVNRKEAMKLILNYYQNRAQFSGTKNEDWGRHLSEFEILCEK